MTTTHDPVLSPHEAAVLLAFADDATELALERIAAQSALDLAQVRSAVERLRLREAVAPTAERVETTVTLTPLGEECARQLLPELRLWQAVAERGSVPVQEIQRRDDLPASEAGAAFGALKTQGAFVLDRGQVRLAPTADDRELRARQALVERVHAAGSLSLDDLTDQEQSWLRDRRLRDLFRLHETRVRSYRLTAAGHALRQQASAIADEIGPLTPAMLRDGSWRGKRFRRYNIGLPPRLVAGARNPYRRFLDQLKQTLLALGFEEMRGSLVENEFWNMDALFMPQFHPARDIHDVYFVAEPAYAQEIGVPWLTNVAAAHEGRGDYGTRGWGYLFNRQSAHRLILRSQGTALSARQLTQEPKIPGKYFSIARCFRYDSVDATHAPDFYQIEGIVLSEQITLRHLLGMLTLFAREVAQAEEIKATPGYYPYTEPSVEMAMKHPVLGWVELGGAGIFRPEVTRPLGIDAPVIAWGLGLDRMAMVALGVNDIRHLFTNNLANGLADLREY
ncbi:MAG: phenylalanine--tRNA ligase subunit alpha [Caldilineaceae bacterium]|nr:phenylalanine--tRNA ligase subunit alpha [Caldilineaceae bacterium]